MRYGIIVRTGSDSASVPIAADCIRELRIGGDGADIDIRSFAEEFRKSGALPPRVALDFLIFAIAVYSADTRINRSAAHDEWTREITLSIPVQDEALWNSSQLTFERALNFLTGDRWTLSFRAASDGLSVEKPDDALSRPSKVSLFSGGLDSFVGALDIASSGEPALFVGHHAFDVSTSAFQKRAFEHVISQSADGQTVSLLRARIVASTDVFKLGRDENERARSLLFIAMGCVVAAGINVKSLQVSENGFISLNVPLNALRVGTYSTRTTHPHFLSTIERGLNEVGLELHLTNPYRHATKGELVKGCRVQDGLVSMAADTMSCAHPMQSRRTRGAPAMRHCGRCTACLIRRAALEHAFGEDKTEYTLKDLSAVPLRSDKAEGRDVRAVRLAAQRLAKAPDLATLIVLKSGPLPLGEYDLYAGVYRRGMDELWQIVENVKTIGAY